MAASHFIRLGRITGKCGILNALKHNKRELQAERGADSHIDVRRSASNYALAGDGNATAIDRHAKVQLVKAGIDTPRINQVMAIEVIFSLPIDYHQRDTKPFFADCYDWVQTMFGCEVLSFDVHLDESAPHAHALILPLLDGKMQGNKLIGDKANLLKIINSFHMDIGKRYGLVRAESKRLLASQRQEIENAVLSGLKSDSALKSAVWPCIRDAIHKDPLPYAQALGITIARDRKSTKSFVDIKRSKGKGTFER